eukprot:7103170-Alexandrium_andersonii.AAC.1
MLMLRALAASGIALDSEFNVYADGMVPVSLLACPWPQIEAFLPQVHTKTHIEAIARTRRSCHGLQSGGCDVALALQASHKTAPERRAMLDA